MTVPTAIAGSASGASAFTPNPAGGPAGSTTLISRLIDFAMGTEAQAGVPQPAMLTSGLGPSGALSAPFTAPASLAAYATAFVGAQASDSADVTGQVVSQTAVQTALQTQASTTSAVNIDQEMANMIQLQNAYGANAKVISAVQAMWSQLLQTVT